MRIAFAPPRHDHAKRWQTALHEGFRKHSVTFGELTDCDVAILWGHGWPDIIERQRSLNRHYLVMEAGYLGDRLQWCSLGFNGLNGRATFAEVDDTSRFGRYFAHLMQPWKRGGSYALIMGQVAGDNAIRHVDINRWYADTARALKALGHTVRFRPHPQSAALGGPRAAPEGAITLDGTLAEALAGAALVCTYNSNSGVDAVLAGVPTVACDRGSMAWEVSAHGLDEAGYRPNRKAWASRLAWRQFTLGECASGEAWGVVRTAIE